MLETTFVKNDNYKDEHGRVYEYVCSWDKSFIDELVKRISRFTKRISWTNPYNNESCLAAKEHLIKAMVGMLSGSDASVSVCYDTVDIFGKPMARFLVRDNRRCWYYLVDISSRLDIEVKYSWWQKLQYKYLKNRLIYGNYHHYLTTNIRVWTTPASYYQIDIGRTRLGCLQNSNAQYAKLGLGLPKGFKLNETLYYERVDYEQRRNFLRGTKR